MNIRQAILRAADSIEAHPELFAFGSIENPNPDCGTPGCAIGWIAHHMGVEDWPAHEDLIAYAMGLIPLRFYYRMEGILEGWRDDATICSKALLLYADKCHPSVEIGSWAEIPFTPKALSETNCED